MTAPAILLLAAGASRRMGAAGDKLTTALPNGQPLLLDRLDMALATGAEVYVTLSPDHPDRRALVSGRRNVTPVTVARGGMADSIAAGVSALAAHIDAVAILPSDLPALTTEDLDAMFLAFDGATPLRACAPDGALGHPVIFPHACFERLKALTGDDGARAVLQKTPPTLYPFEDARACTDLDTPSDWAAWRDR